MDIRKYRNNYIFVLVELVLFLILFCFLTEISKQFFREMIILRKRLSINIFFLSVFVTLVFYTFISDLNERYKKAQLFFFRTTFYSLFAPSFLLLLGFVYLIFPKVFNFSFNRGVFVFWGGFFLTCHLIFIAREIKGRSLFDFVHYLFTFSLFYLLNLVLLGLYLRIGFKFHLTRVIVDGMKGGGLLMKTLFIHIFK